MHRERLRQRPSARALYIILALAVAVPIPRTTSAQTAEQRIDLDGNPVNGAESRVVTRVISTFPVQVENTIFNNAGGSAYRIDWDGAGPGGFNTSIAPGPGVGSQWVWSTTSVVYTIESPVVFTPMLDLPVFGQSTDGIGLVGSGNERVFIVPGKSTIPTQVTLSSASLTSSLITFFSPAETKANCGATCVDGQCDMFVENLTGATATIRGVQPGCCSEPHQIICGGECFSYLDDVQNCGGCGNTCGEGEVCSGGECMCPEGLTQCGDGCVDLATDSLNCGECASECLSEQSCVEGGCLCPGGEMQCSSACVDASSDPLNCGECGTACLPEASCIAGDCACPGSEAVCGEECVDLGADPLHCGTCGNACLSDQSCSGGACVCPGGEAVCGEECVDLGTDESHCGACGSPCAGGQFCFQSQCFCLEEGLTNCAGACIDLQNDEANCGSCGNVCDSPLVCSGGACGCPSGLALCGGACVDLQNDEANCGACGNACGAGSSCGAGQCSIPCDDDDDNGGGGNCKPPKPVSSAMTWPAMSQGVPAAAPSALSMVQDSDLSLARATAASQATAASPQDRVTVGGARTRTAKPRESRSLQAPDARRDTAPRKEARQDAPRSASAISVEEAPVCDIAAFEAVVPNGESFILSQEAARYGKEVYTTVTIEAEGSLIAQGPCPIIVPVTDADTTGAILSPVKVATVDSTGDGICQPSEGFCNYFISLDNVGDTACLNPVATLSSLPDEANPNEVIFLNNTSAYPTWPGFPGGGLPPETKTNLTAFSIATPEEQLSNVGRRFDLSVNCANLEQDIVAPVVLGIGGVCNPATDLDGKSYDVVNGFQSPVSAQLVLEGAPVNTSTKKYNQGSTVPLRVALSCGTLVLGDEHIDPKPEIVAIIHETLGPQPLENINGHDQANPNDPLFRCDAGGVPTAACQYQLRTEQLPIGTYVLGIRMPDARVFQAGFIIKP